MDVNIVSIKRSLPLQLFSKNSFDLLMSMLNHASSKKNVVAIDVVVSVVIVFCVNFVYSSLNAQCTTAHD